MRNDTVLTFIPTVGCDFFVVAKDINMHAKGRWKTRKWKSMETGTGTENAVQWLYLVTIILFLILLFNIDTQILG